MKQMTTYFICMNGLAAKNFHQVIYRLKMLKIQKGLDTALAPLVHHWCSKSLLAPRLVRAPQFGKH